MVKVKENLKVCTETESVLNVPTAQLLLGYQHNISVFLGDLEDVNLTGVCLLNYFIQLYSLTAFPPLLSQHFLNQANVLQKLQLWV